MKRILILGGTGFVGRHICTRLSQAGWSAIVPSRSPAAARHLAGLPRVDVVPGDVHDEATLIRLLAGADAVVNLVAILHGSEAAFEQVHVELPKKLARACAAAGVRRLVQISALGAALDGPSMYQRSKARGEAVLHTEAAADFLDLTVLRPSVIFGAQDKFLNVFAQLQRMFPLIPLAGADTRFQPVWVEDVAAAVMRCLQDDATIGQTFEACGPEVFTLRDLVRLAGQYAGVNQGRGRAVFALPMPLARVQAWVMERLPGEPLMSGDNLDSMAVDNIASGKVPGLDALGITPAALAAIAPGYLRKR
ncbi:MAG: complex I NDUFA9 subunit family protein [Burkholderiaceae bacterium]|nr:complex I NDUFA9 subunit family protein [Burkholderiaceae bacterium]